MIYARVSYYHQEKCGFIVEDKIQFIEGSVFGWHRLTGETANLAEVSFLPPVQPSKVVAVGLNYKDHIQEMGLDTPKNPTLFLKPSTAVIGDKDSIHIPEMSRQVDYEGELALVINKRASHVRPDQAKNYILGYTCLNDVTARDLQAVDGQWIRAKGFDTFCLLGPIVTDQVDPQSLNIKTCLNGKIRQSSNTREFLWNVYELVSFVSCVMTLLPGDVITTGTPSGIGPMQAGDVVEVTIEGIGTLQNFVS